MISSLYSESSILTGDRPAMIFSWGAYRAKIFDFKQLPPPVNHFNRVRHENPQNFEKISTKTVDYEKKLEHFEIGRRKC